MRVFSSKNKRQKAPPSWLEPSQATEKFTGGKRSYHAVVPQGNPLLNE